MKLTKDVLELLLQKQQVFYLVNFVECGPRVCITTTYTCAYHYH